MGPCNLNQMFDRLAPTPEQERDMLERLLNQKKEVNPMRNITKLTAIAAAAALLLTACAFTIMTGLDQRLLDYFGAGPENAEQLSAAGVSVGQSYTYANGWTVEICEILVDRSSIVALVNYTAPEGMALPVPETEDEFLPDFGYAIYTPSGECVDNVPRHEKGHVGYGHAGCEYLESSRPEEGVISMLWIYRGGVGKYYKEEPTVYTTLGAQLTLKPVDLVIQSTGETISFADEAWDCTVTLPETDTGVTYTVQQPLQLGEETVELSTVYISPINVCYEYGDFTRNGDYAMILYEQGAQAYYLTLKDGSTVSFRDPFGLSASAVGNDHTYSSQGQAFQGITMIVLQPEQFVTPGDVVSMTLFDQTFTLE